MAAFLKGYSVSLALIVAIGAQNAFVLRQGLLKQHVLAVVMICACSDAVLIVAGILGMGRLAEAAPGFELAMRLGGAAFLLWYGWINARSAWRGGAALETEGAGAQSLKAAALTVLAFTWLNPHVYLDTVVIVGSVAAQSPNRLAFGVGAILASFSFFFALGYGARLLRPVFANPRAWRVLDTLIALTMWSIALSLLYGVSA